MTIDRDNGNGSRVTTRSLNDKLDAFWQRNIAEHWKTRLIVAIVAFPSAAKNVPTLVGFLHFW